MPPGKLVGMGRTSGGVVGVFSLGGGVLGGEVDFDRERDRERFLL